ncbi:MAG: B-box zinc finger protein [Dehalococcoidales bacterium]|nr:B-box zinc finger protein [Dehalococcoidales bacterium]
MTEPDMLRCATHPGVETNLRCGKCDKLICPKCMVITAVGARCKDCAGSTRLPTYRVSAKQYLKAAGVALLSGIVIGFVWGLIELLLPVYFFSLLLSGAAGFAIGEIISRAVNRKKGTGLSIIGGLALLLAFGIVYAIELNRFGYLDFSWIRIAYSFLSAGVGVFVAVNRLR